MVEVLDRPIIERIFDQLISLGIEEIIVVVGHLKDQIIDEYGENYRGLPINYCIQRDQRGLAHALLTTEDQIDDSFVLVLGDNLFRANLSDVIDHHRESSADATLLVEEVPIEEASRYGVCHIEDNQVTSIVEKPMNPSSNQVITGFYVFDREIFDACHQIEPSDRGEYELSDAIDMMIRSDRTIESVQMRGWRIDIGYPRDRDRAERQLD